jgi:tetratricopeptide (TPR) repeat protein
MAGTEDDANGDFRRISPTLQPPTRGTVHPPNDSAREATGEDFLFHLYRGSELLQDSRVLEAKEELERALLLQPRDPKGQDLLATVYFRIGAFPRAIQIYERLRADSPEDISLKLNLALCYLKVGQAQAARVELEEVVRLHPEHRRAWGYLGLAYERVAELEKAINAFERGGHAAMAKRISERRTGNSVRIDAAQAAESVEIREAASQAFNELDAGELSFALAAPATHQTGTWRSIELGEAADPPPGDRNLHNMTAPPPPSAEAARVRSMSSLASPAQENLPSLGDLARTSFFDTTAPMQLDPSGHLAIRLTRGERSFAARLDALRLYSGVIQTSVLERRARGASLGEPFGGMAGPLVRIAGDGPLLLGPRPSRHIVAFSVREEVFFLREDVVLAFDLAMNFESSSLSWGDEEALRIVQMRGPGAIAIELLEPLRTLDVTASSHDPEVGIVSARASSVIGWIGRLVPRPVVASDAPSGQRGLISFSGDGTLLLSGR